MTQVVEAKKRGRKPMTPEQKLEAKQAREAAVQANTAGKQPEPKPAKAEKAPKEPKASKPPKPAKVTENSKTRVEDLSDDQHFALLMQHSRKIGEFEAALTKAKAAHKGAQDLARAELGKDALHEIKQFADLQTEAGQRKLKDKLNRTARIMRWAQMPVGHIEDLFAEPDRTPVDEKIAKAGKAAGLAGETGSPPTNLSGPNQQIWLTAYHEGQAVLHKGFKSTKEPEGFGSPDEDKWYRAGAKARKAGIGAVVPETCPREYAEAFLDGHRDATPVSEKDAAFYREEGRLDWERQSNGDIPTDVPMTFWQAYKDGWNDRKTEHEATNKPRLVG